jgi:hypothetical protein
MESTDQATTFPAAHPEVGTIEIAEDGPEVIVYLGNFTHSHFANYDKSLSPEQAAEKITADIVALLDDIFADKVVFWGSHRGGGGYFMRGAQSPHSRGQQYVWSGPIREQG